MSRRLTYADIRQLIIICLLIEQVPKEVSIIQIMASKGHKHEAGHIFKPDEK